MNMKKLSLIPLLALGALILSACSGSRTAVSNWPGLAADSKRAYLSAGSQIYAVDLKTGKEVWRYPAAADSKHVFFASAVLSPDGQLLVGSEGTVHAFVSINPETGKDNWATPFTGARGPWVASPLVLNDTIYAPNSDGYIYVLDMNGKPSDDPIQIGGALWSAPATDGKLLYITSLDHHLHVIDPAKQSQGDPIDLGGAAPSSPAVSTDGAYVGSFASGIEFVGSDGRHEAIAKASGWIWGKPTLEDETLYYADLNGKIYSFDLASGKQNWGDVSPDGAIVASLLVDADRIYVASEAGNLIALDRDAKQVWEKEVGGKLYTTPLASADLILVAPYQQADYLLAAYDADGKQAWTFAPAK